ALRLYRPNAPEALERVVTKALAKQPEERFPDAESFAAALVPFGGRMVENDDSASDSLSTDLLKIRARERRKGPPGQSQPPPPRGPHGTLPGRQRAAARSDSDDLAIDRIALDVGPAAWNRGHGGAPAESAPRKGSPPGSAAGPAAGATNRSAPSPL